MFKFLHAADIHLDSPMQRLEVYEGAPVEAVRQASRRAFENLVELARTEAVDFVLIAGDLFDGDWKDYNTGLFFVDQIRRLKEAGIDVFMVTGNHDAASRITLSLPYPDNVYLFSHRKAQTRRLESIRAAVHGQSFGTATVQENLAASFPEAVPGYFNIGLLHTSLTGREGHATYAPCTLDDLKTRGYDYWALGHVHQHEIVSKSPAVIFPGCIQGRHIRETGVKGCVMVTAEEDAMPEIATHPLDVIRWEHVTVDLSGANTPQTCLDRFKEALEPVVEAHAPRPVIVRAGFIGETRAHDYLAGDPERWKESLRSVALAEFGDQAWIEKVSLFTRPHRRGDLSAPGPLRELARVVADIKTDEDRLHVLGLELKTLYKKLPAEFRRGSGALHPDSAAELREVVDQAHSILVRRLRRETEDHADS